jgi:hypothetical protein
VVIRAVPFTLTRELATNPLPVIVIVVPAAATAAELGDMLATCGSGLLIATATSLDVPPPGAGFITSICPLPAVAMSALVSVTCSCVALTYVVVRAV